MAVQALGGDVVISARNEETGELRTFVHPPATGDRKLDEIIALASVPVDFTPLDEQPVDEALVAAAGRQAAADVRLRVAERRREEAESHFQDREREIALRHGMRLFAEYAAAVRRRKRRRSKTPTAPPRSRTDPGPSERPESAVVASGRLRFGVLLGGRSR
jgi:hypothetical protein